MPHANNPDPPRTPTRILFVCSGNTCRSPLAEAIGRRAAAEKGLKGAEFRSAGTSTAPGLPASGGSARAAARHGLSLEAHVSRSLSPDLVAWADLVLAMAPSHFLRVLEMGGDGKTALLGAFARGEDHAMEPAVPDPFGGDDREYEETYLTLEPMVASALDRILAEGLMEDGK